MKSKFYQFGLFAIAASLTTSPAWSGTINVALGGSIQAAIDEAAHDDTIVLSAGTYTLTETLVLGDKNAAVAKRIHLKGAGKDQTIIKGAGAPASFTTGYAPEAPLIRLEWAPSHNGAIPAAGGISENSGTSIEDLTIAGWETSSPGDGYLLWAGGVQDVHIKNVAFESNNNRVAIYNDNGDGTKIENCDFRGTYYRFVYRGAGRRMEFLNNNFDVTIAEAGGLIALEYGRGTNALIQGNLFRHTVAGPNYSVSASAHRTIWNTNPLNPADGTNALTITDNDFQFIVRGANGAGKFPVPVAIENQRGSFTLSQDPGAPTVITGNTFSGYDYQGSDVANPAVISTHLRSTVTENAFTPRVKSRALLTGTGTPALNATGNFWGSAAGPGPNDLSGSIDAGSPATGVPSSITGPVSIAGETGTYLTISEALAAASSGDTITLSAGTFQEAPISITKQVTIQGPNATIPGTGERAAEAIIDNTQIFINAPGAVIEGVRIYQTNNTADTILVQGNATIRNNIFDRDGVTTGAIARAITTAGGLTDVSITGNLFTGDASGSFFSGHKTWQSGIYSNGGPAVITGNTFENCRAALNLDNFNAGINLSGNIFRSCGTYIAFGGTAPTDGSLTIAGNDFGIDLATPGLPSAFFNNSNVAPTFRIDATGNTFGGKATTELVDADKFAIEARILHRGRGNRNGVVDFVAGQQVVAKNSEYPGAAGIGSAIAAASVGNTVLVGPGSFVEDVIVNKTVTLQGSGAAVSTISGAIDGGHATVQIAASDVTVDGFKITREGNSDWNNPLLNSTGIAIQGVALTGTVIRNNEISGNRSGIDINLSSGHQIRNNVIQGNHTGIIFRNQTNNIIAQENEITANRTVGVLFLDASGGDNDPVQEAAGTSFANNNISGNWYGQIVDRQPAGISGAKLFAGNWLGTISPVATTADSGEPAYSGLTPGSTPPVGKPEIAGQGSANIIITPFLASGTDTDLGAYGFQGDTDTTVNGVFEDVVVDGTTPPPTGDVYVAPGKTITVQSTGSFAPDSIELAPGAEIEVNGGSLTLNGNSTISGTFTIFNSFGSWNINGPTTFDVSQSLALITDIHVAPAATVTVNGGGELILDGCVINSQTPGTPFSVEVAADGFLTVARSVVTDANINIDTVSAGDLRSRVFDNSFTTSDIEASVDARVFHNLFDATTDAAANTDGTTAFDAIDGWGNVTDPAALQNKFTLDFEEPADPTQTLDANGNLFVRTGQPVVMKMNVANLGANTITTAEALLGYSSDMLTLVGPSPAADPVTGWQVIVEEATDDGTFGLVDSAIGLNIAGPGDNGISADTNIANVNFTAGAPGITVGFFRVQADGAFNPDGSFVKDTRLTKSVGGVPSYLASFTANTGELIIDNEDPTINNFSGTQTITQVQPSESGPVNVLDANRVLRSGSDAVVLTFTATDAGLAGLDTVDAENDLVLNAENGTTTLDASNHTITATEASGVVTYTVTLDIPDTATNGEYTVYASLQDRSGNVSSFANLGSFVIANEVVATVELDGFTGTTRDVTFVATDASGTSLDSWTKPVTFVSGTGSVALEDVPAGTTSISAKTAWTLRSKVSAPLSAEGVGSADLTGTFELKGGDLNNDNVINTLDYSILRYNWMTVAPAANISGDSAGGVNTSDYTILNANFYSVGSAE